VAPLPVDFSRPHVAIVVEVEGPRSLEATTQNKTSRFRSTRAPQPRLSDELKEAADLGLASCELMSPDQVAQYTGVFRDRFGPAVLRELDG
jgi:hypothetical protein